MQDQESRLPLALFLVGVAVALVGNFISISMVMKAGFLCICIAIVVFGIEMLITGRAIFSAWGGGQSWGHYERFSGLTARMWGILFILLALVLGVLTIADALSAQGAEMVVSKFVNTPRGFGLFLLGGGGTAMMYGIIRMVAGTALPGSGAGAFVSNSLERIFGGVVLVIGFVLASLGVVLVIAPDILLVPLDGILQGIPTPPIPPAR